MLCNAIHIILTMNKIKWLIAEGVLHCIISIIVSNYIEKESQLLLYI